MCLDRVLYHLKIPRKEGAQPVLANGCKYFLPFIEIKHAGFSVVVCSLNDHPVLQSDGPVRHFGYIMFVRYNHHRHAFPVHFL